MKSKSAFFNEMAHLAEGARADKKEILASLSEVKQEAIPMSTTKLEDKEWIVQELGGSQSGVERPTD